MTRQIAVVCLLVASAALITGCQDEQKTTSLEPGIGQSDQQSQTVQYQDEQSKKSWTDSLWPGNWFASSGQSEKEDKITKHDVWWNMSPELSTIDESDDESHTDHARVFDTNGREIWKDLDRALLLDEPSHLSLYPVP